KPNMMMPRATGNPMVVNADPMAGIMPYRRAAGEVDSSDAPRSHGRLLLSDAVDAAAAREDRPRIDGHHPAARILPLQDRPGHRIRRRIAETAGDHPTIDDQMVDVAPVDETVGVTQGGGGGQRHDLEGAARR